MAANITPTPVVTPTPANTASHGDVQGQAWSGLKRTFTFDAPDWVHANADPAGTACLWERSIPIANVTAIANYISYFPTAQVLDAQLTIIPGPAWANQATRVYVGLTQAQLAAPATVAAMRLEPTTRCLIFQSALPNALPMAVTRSFKLGDYGCGPQIKPVPLVGGVPRINLVATNVLTAARGAGSTACSFELEVTIGVA